MKKFTLLKASALVAATLLLPSGVSQASSTQSPAPSMKDQMKSMNQSHQSTQNSSATPAPMGGTYFSLSIPAEVLAAKLFDTNGKPITLNDFKGRFLVLAPFLTSCQEICPMTTANMLSISQSISKANLGNRAKVLEISVDSERDSSMRLKAYQALYGDNSWVMAGGSAENLRKLWNYFGVSATKSPYSSSDLKGLPLDWQTGKKNTFDVAHTDAVIIISPDQKWKWLDLGSPNIGKSALPSKLKSFLDAQGISNLTKPEEPTWTVDAVNAALSHLLGKKIS